MEASDSPAAAAVLLFGDGDLPGALTALPTHRVAEAADIDTAIGPHRRLLVVGGDADLAFVLTRLLRAERLDIEVGYVTPQRTAATRIYRVPTGARAARRALRGSAERVPLIRDETGAAIVGRAEWRPAEGQPQLQGEAVVDDTVLFDGAVSGARIEPTRALPGLRASLDGRLRRWVAGRAAQLGSTGVTVVRDGVPAARPARRSTFYRHIEGWLLVR